LRRADSYMGGSRCGVGHTVGGRGNLRDDVADWAGREEWRAKEVGGSDTEQVIKWERQHISATSPSGSWLSGGCMHTPSSRMVTGLGMGNAGPGKPDP
jgi:hypothetical protein